MKASAAYLLTFALGAVQAQASVQCVDGHREMIGPDYMVEYKCDLVRQGDVHNNIATQQQCAELCKNAGRSVCTYHPPTRRCVVGQEGGRDIPRPGAIYMQKVEEDVYDPFTDPQDPFGSACEDEKAACLLRESNLQAELAKTQTEAEDSKDLFASSCPVQHTKYTTVGGRDYRIWCSRYHDTSSPKETYNNVDTMAACIKLCSSKSWCTYVLHGNYLTNCQLYERKVSHTTTPGLVGYIWNCAVKK
ncbi:hypothetical protein NW755_013187 [Fusarium falciforme]|uniref:Apple domain-containing protein n=1 Tax=Fusarium falciforme TaxID=195108 RepID=A0A9W8QV44_9HYPO|nr:hypothetical protein NW755_013187 [Fusarium falciforme]KAJ4246409.1 hypothetical protein NW757_009454 [Fusarium falciforme]